jgi:predicted nuclease with TOPRIM domain
MMLKNEEGERTVTHYKEQITAASSEHSQWKDMYYKQRDEMNEVRRQFNEIAEKNRQLNLQVNEQIRKQALNFRE